MENKLEILLEKLERKEEKKYIYYDEYLDMDLEIKKLSLRKYSKITDGITNSTDKTLTSMYQIIYEHVPLFQSKELFDKYNVQKKESVIPLIYDENLKPMEKLASFINNEVYQLETSLDTEKK